MATTRPRIAVLAVLAVLPLPAVALAGPLAGGEWPMFRGPAASGIGTGAPPLSWNGESGQNVLWKTELPGLGHASPIVWGDRIFITTAVPDAGEASLKLGLYGDIQPVEGEGAQRFVVLALDRTSGKIVWQHTAFHGMPAIKRHTKATHANSTPATDGTVLVAFFGSEGLYAYDLAGKPLWHVDFGTLDAGFFMVPGAQGGFASSPVLRDGRVIVQVDVQKDSFVAALDARTGRELWRTPRADVPTWSTPAVVPASGAPGETGRQVVVNGWKHIGGYDFSTGAELWRMKGGGDIPVPTPQFDGTRIVITSAHGPARPIYAIRPDARGDITGNTTFIAWQQAKAGNYMQTPLLHDGLGYFCMDNGVLSVYDLATGERVYQQRLGAGNRGFTSSAVAADGRLYATDEDGVTYVLKLGRTFEQLAQNDLGESVMASPAIADGVLYQRGRKHLYALATR